MLTLHAAGTCDDLLALWAEDATRAGTPRRRCRRKATHDIARLLAPAWGRIAEHARKRAFKE